MRLDEKQDFLINLCRHVLISEGFPQAGMTKESEPLSRRMGFSFGPAPRRLILAQGFICCFAYQWEDRRARTLSCSWDRS